MRLKGATASASRRMASSSTPESAAGECPEEALGPYPLIVDPPMLLPPGLSTVDEAPEPGVGGSDAPLWWGTTSAAVAPVPVPEAADGGLTGEEADEARRGA